MIRALKRFKRRLEPKEDYSYLIGSRWRGASGSVYIVSRLEGTLTFGKWDTGDSWSASIYTLEAMYRYVGHEKAPQ